MGELLDWFIVSTLSIGHSPFDIEIHTSYFIFHPSHFFFLHYYLALFEYSGYTYGMKERELIRRWISWKRERENGSFFQKDLAEKAGLSVTYLSNIMTGTRNPGTRTLERITGALGISMAEFYAGPPQSFNSAASVKFNGVSVNDRAITAGALSSGAESPRSGETEKEDELNNTGLALSETSPEKIEKLFSSIGVSLEELCPSTPEHSPEIKETPREIITRPAIPESRTVLDKIPLLTHVPPGDWRTWFDGSIEDSFSAFVPRISVYGDYCFAVKIDDKCMIPDLYKGDLLIINPEEKFTNIHGGIGVIVHQNRFIARKVYTHKGEYMLVPSNPVHKIEYTPMEGTRIFKVALWIPDARNKF